MRNYYVKGDWNALCQRCGFKYKASALKEEWTGLRVCTHCWSPRHPQDFVRGREDDQSVPWASPEPVDVFVASGQGDVLLTEADTGAGTVGTWIQAENGSFLLTET